MFIVFHLANGQQRFHVHNIFITEAQARACVAEHRGLAYMQREEDYDLLNDRERRALREYEDWAASAFANEPRANAPDEMLRCAPDHFLP